MNILVRGNENIHQLLQCETLFSLQEYIRFNRTALINAIFN